MFSRGEDIAIHDVVYDAFSFITKDVVIIFFCLIQFQLCPFDFWAHLCVVIILAICSFNKGSFPFCKLVVFVY